MKKHVNRELFLTVLILTLVPLCLSYFLLGDVLETALNLGFNGHVNSVLDAAQSNLLKLREQAGEQTEAYREQFQKIQELKVIYENPAALKQNLRKTLLSYYGILILLGLLIALSAALLLSRRISRAYDIALEILLEERERASYLREVALWQGVARRMAHEIKNALTPIEILTSSFRSERREEVQLVVDQIAQLKKMTLHFSQFATLPKAQLCPTDLNDFLTTYLKAHASSWLQCNFTSRLPSSAAWIDLDPDLFRQVLGNLIRNAQEANPSSEITVMFELDQSDKEVTLQVSNTGVGLPEDVRTKIFNEYFSTKERSDNMGLGLSIVKKIIIEHGGFIECVPSGDGARFNITLPKSYDR